MDIVQAGNTVRLTCKFYDIYGELTNPSFAKLTFYDYQYIKENEVILNEANRLSLGTYYYDLVTEKKERRYIYEWLGEIEGFPSIKRDGFVTKFI